MELRRLRYFVAGWKTSRALRCNDYTSRSRPRYLEYLSAIFARVNDKPRLVTEHDGWSGVFSAVAVGNDVALTSDAFDYAFNDRIKCLRLTAEPKRIVIGIITRKDQLGPAADKFCQCAKEAFAAPHLIGVAQVFPWC